jgi:hypothetical protein
MIPPFDIFQAGTDGSVCWLGTAATLQDAAARVQALETSQPREYVIFNQRTGREFVIKLDSMAALSRLNHPGAIAPQSAAQETQNGE